VAYTDQISELEHVIFELDLGQYCKHHPIIVFYVYVCGAPCAILKRLRIFAKGDTLVALVYR
jgi:hypothetical protein